jgi:hypothetical protein
MSCEGGRSLILSGLSSRSTLAIPFRFVSFCAFVFGLRYDMGPL